MDERYSNPIYDPYKDANGIIMDVGCNVLVCNHWVGNVKWIDRNSLGDILYCVENIPEQREGRYLIHDLMALDKEHEMLWRLENA